MRLWSMTRMAGPVGLALLASCGGSTGPYGGGGGGGGGGGMCTPSGATLCMGAASFNPATLTITAGTTVTWQSPSGNPTHTVTSATGSTDVYGSADINGGGSFSHKFATAGTYHYYCKYHGTDGNPPTGMAGTITVN